MYACVCISLSLSLSLSLYIYIYICISLSLSLSLYIYIYTHVYVYISLSLSTAAWQVFGAPDVASASRSCVDTSCDRALPAAVFVVRICAIKISGSRYWAT